MQRSEPDRIVVELAALRRELAELRAEQQQLAERVDEMAKTFRALATQIGIATEPYKGGSGRRSSEPAGFA